MTSLANACYGFFVLPESLPPDRRAPFAWRRANPVGSLVLLRSHHELFGLAAVTFLGHLGHAVLPSTAVLYLGYRYGWGSAAVGLVLAAVGTCAMIVQGALVKPITASLGERRTLLLGLFCGALGFLIYGLAPTGALYCAGIPVMALWGLSGPAAQALMTRRVSTSEQGQLQGAIASFVGIAGLIGPTLFTRTFAFFIGADELGPATAGWTPDMDLPGLDPAWHVPGAPFLLASLLLLLAMGVAWKATTPRSPIDRMIGET
jgi:DHA1 family tetracycline resistance protein-like MFS transporter